MNFLKNKILSTDEINRMSSNYISEGRYKEKWQINKIIISDKTAVMNTSMSTITCDDADFHLSIFTAEEMASQLMIICGHLWAQLGEKNKEVWMLESNTKNIKPIKNKNNITVNLNLRALKKMEDKIFGIADFIVSDNNHGLIKITQKGILS